MNKFVRRVTKTKLSWGFVDGYPSGLNVFKEELLARWAGAPEVGAVCVKLGVLPRRSHPALHWECSFGSLTRETGGTEVVTAKTGRTLQNALWALGNAPFNWSASLWVSGSRVSAAGGHPLPPRGAPGDPATPLSTAAAPGCSPVSGRFRKGTALGWFLSRMHLPSFYAPGLWPVCQWVRDVTLAVRFFFRSFPRSCPRRLLTRPSSEPWIRARWRGRSGGTPTWSPCWGEVCARAPGVRSARLSAPQAARGQPGLRTGDVFAKVMLKKWLFLILAFKNTLDCSVWRGCGLSTINQIRDADSQFVGFRLVSLSLLPLRNAAVVKEGEDERGRKWVSEGGKCVKREEMSV